jgi:hypothetical protein
VQFLSGGPRRDGAVRDTAAPAAPAPAPAYEEPLAKPAGDEEIPF